MPHVEPGELGRVACRQPCVFPGVPQGHRNTPHHPRAACPVMISDVLLSQACAFLAMARIDTFVGSQMPAVQRRMLIDMTMFDSRVLRDVT